MEAGQAPRTSPGSTHGAGMPLSSGRSAQGSRPWLVAAGVMVVYLGLAILVFLPDYAQWSLQLNGCNCWDQILEEWSISWFPAAVSHGHGVFSTSYLDAPGGVNLMWNTSMPLLSLLAAPLVAAAGPVHAFTILMTLALATSAATMYLLLRRWVRSALGCGLGGLLYGFSSYSLAEANPGRLHLIFLALLPLLVLLLDHLIRDPQPRARRLGAGLGLLAAAQLLIAEEPLAIFAGFLMLALLLGAALRPGPLWARRDVVRQALGPAGLAFLLLAGYPLAVQFFGPDRLTGPAQSHQQLALFSGDLLALVMPGPNQLLSVGGLARVAAKFATSTPAEVTEYVGLPLLVFLLAGVWVRRREFLVRLLAVVGLTSYVLTLGPRLIVLNHHTGIPLPYALLAHVPVAGNIMPSRIALGMWFAVAGLFALTLDVGVAQGRGSRLPGGTGRGRGFHAALALLAAAAVVPLLPSLRYPEVPAATPSFFTSREVGVIPENALVLTYPYALDITDQPMLWQATTRMQFRLLGGYIIAPAPGGAGTFFADGNPWEYCFLTVYLKGKAPPDLCNVPALRKSAAQLGVAGVVVDAATAHSALADSLMREVLGVAGREMGGVWVWSCRGRGGQRSCSWRSG
jgi:hypothetical protein